MDFKIDENRCIILADEKTDDVDKELEKFEKKLRFIGVKPVYIVYLTDIYHDKTRMIRTLYQIMTSGILMTFYSSENDNELIKEQFFIDITSFVKGLLPWVVLITPDDLNEAVIKEVEKGVKS